MSVDHLSSQCRMSVDLVSLAGSTEESVLKKCRRSLCSVNCCVDCFCCVNCCVDCFLSCQLLCRLFLVVSIGVSIVFRRVGFVSTLCRVCINFVSGLYRLQCRWKIMVSKKVSMQFCCVDCCVGAFLPCQLSS